MTDPCMKETVICLLFDRVNLISQL